MTSLYLTAYGGSILGPIAKVLGWVMDKIYVFFANVCHIESIALTILIFTILIYVCMFPVTYNQQKFSVLSKKMQPEINALNEKYKGKKVVILVKGSRATSMDDVVTALRRNK